MSLVATGDRMGLITEEEAARPKHRDERKPNIRKSYWVFIINSHFNSDGVDNVVVHLQAD